MSLKIHDSKLISKDATNLAQIFSDKFSNNIVSRNHRIDCHLCETDKTLRETNSELHNRIAQNVILEKELKILMDYN
jgi:DNA-binding sugar fermentation-stimulating protein